MTAQGGVARRRRDREGTRRRVLDAVVATVLDVGYYKASSNEIARRAGVSWGSIDHLFGSREQLMLDVVNDLGEQLEQRIAEAEIGGETIEERMSSLFDVLATHYEQGKYLVQMQILLDLSANPKMSAHGRKEIRRNDDEEFDRVARPLIAEALGELSAERDLVVYAYQTMRGYLTSAAFARLIAGMPNNAVVRIIGDGQTDENVVRGLVVRGIVTTLREVGRERGYTVV